MAITYHSGRRIQGTPTYLDNFEYASQSTADAKWIPATTLVRVNVTNNTLGYTIERHTTNDTCYYDLGTANISETKWVCRFKLVTTAVNGGGSSHKMGFFGLSSGTGSWSTSVDKIGFHHQISSNTAERDIHPAYASDGNYGAGSQAELSTQVVAGTHYYELSRLSSSEYRITISSTDAYNGNVEDETYTNLSGITGLQYFVIVNANDYTISGSLVGYIDDLKFYNGVTSISSGNVQVGSRYEETDTRKMYHYISTSETNQETNSGTGELMNDVEIIAQKFTANSSKLGKKVMSVEVLLKRNTSTIASTNVECFVGVGYPIGSTAVSYGSFTASDLTTDYVWYKFTPTSGTERTLVTNDRIMIRWADGAVSDNSVRMASDQSGNNPLANETGQYSADDGSSWADRSFDYCYKIHYDEPSWKEEGT